MFFLLREDRMPALTDIRAQAEQHSLVLGLGADLSDVCGGGTQEWQREEARLCWSLRSLDQEFLITDLLELHRLLSGLRAVNHIKTAAGVAMTSPWPSCTLFSSRYFSLGHTHLAIMSFCYTFLPEKRITYKNIYWNRRVKCWSYGCKMCRCIIPGIWRTHQFYSCIWQNTEKSAPEVLLIFLLAGTSVDVWMAVDLAITAAEQIRCSNTSQDHITHSTANHCHSLNHVTPPSSSPPLLLFPLCLSASLLHILAPRPLIQTDH